MSLFLNTASDEADTSLGRPFHTFAPSGQRRLLDTIEDIRLQFAGHVIRMAPERPANHAMNWIPADGKRKRGRPQKTWWWTFQEDLSTRGVSLGEVKTIAADRVRWRTLLSIVS